MSDLYRVHREDRNCVRRKEFYGFKDPWGREMGAVITTYDCEFSAAPSTTYYGLSLDEAERRAAKDNEKPFLVWCKQTRDGQGYGASSSGQFYATIEERDAHIARYLKRAVKTAEKSVAKAAAKRAARRSA